MNLTDFNKYARLPIVNSCVSYYPPSRQPVLFYGWYIVAVGFLSQMVLAFHLSSTLSVFLKPLTEELCVSRGLFSLMRSGELIIAATIAPFVGSLVDRYGSRWLVTAGALGVGIGFILLGRVNEFWQFLLLRWTFVTVGGVCMSTLVFTVTISRWFVKKRGRAIAIASLGQGFSKVLIPLLVATLLVSFGWRQTWHVFGVASLVLVVVPAIVFLRRTPEDMGLMPDGITEPWKDRPADYGTNTTLKEAATVHRQVPDGDVVWRRKDVLRTRTFWIIAFTFGIVSVGISGLNLHIFSHVSDIGYPPIVSATVMSIIAFTQFGSTMLWGLISERMDIRKSTMLMFLIQATGLSCVVMTGQLYAIYLGYFVYGAGLGGSHVLQELIWASYYGRTSLGKVRGMGIFVTYIFAAAGAPFFGFLHDVTGSYHQSFIIFIAALLVSAFLILLLRPLRK
jgi:MFS family permease